MTADDVIAFMERYFHRLHSIELSDADVMARMNEFKRLGDEDSTQAVWDEQIAKKLQVYREFWNRDDDFWEPRYLDDRPNHDWERVEILAVKTNGRDCFAFHYAYDIGIGDPYENITLIKVIDGELKIVDQLS